MMPLPFTASQAMTGTPRFMFEARYADVEPRLAREVHHVQDQNHGAAKIEDLVNEIEIPLEIRRVDDAEDSIGLGRVRAPPEQDVAG